MRFWDLISFDDRLKLLLYQAKHHKKLLELYSEWLGSQKETMDTLPENEKLARFMAQAPHKQAKVK